MEKMKLLIFLLLAGCTQPTVRRYGEMIDPKIGSANKNDMARLFGVPIICRPEGIYETCEFRTARGNNAPVPSVHQQNPAMGPDLSPYEHFDVILLQFDALGVLRSWKPHHVN